MNKILRSLLLGVVLLIGTNSNAQILFSESFSGGSLPAGWTNDSLGQTPMNVWIFNNFYSRVITGAGFDTHFAIFDSDEGSTNDGIPELASLTTPSIDISTANGSLFLDLDEQYRSLSGPLSDGSSRTISYSTNGGTSWTVLVFDTTDLGYPNPAVHSRYDLSALIGIANNIMVRFTWTGSWDWWWAIDNVQVLNVSPCNAPPNAGTASSLFTSVCTTDTIQLYLTGADVASGLTYQWQSSPDGTTWTDILGATDSVYLVAQTTATYYQCNVTCSGQTASSGSIQITMNPSTACYCTPLYTNGCDAIAKVGIRTLLNVSTDCNGNLNNYILYPDTGVCTTSLEQGLDYTLTFASGPGTGNHGAAVWFDFDHSGDFQGSGEFFHISDSIPEVSPDFTTTVSVPAGAVLGNTRMRVRYVYNAPATVAEDCSDQSYGETEDYIVHIILPVGISETILNQVSVYPSPATTELHIALGQLKGQSRISVLDLTGQVVKSLTVNNELESKLDCSKWSTGVYFVRVENEIGSITRKVIINK
ncbi:MAG: GEVED domain-containing protein [Bacteroidia bacterium]